MRQSKTTAFSLVELSIVLVILGLLVGGILAGQSLIRAAELRAITTEHQRYLAAVNSFRDKYFSLPGDMRNATSFWGTDSGNCANQTTAVGTCNGDGDKVLGLYGEPFRFWQHLALAGMIEGTYSATAAGSSSFESLIGTNIPRSRFPLGGWYAGSYYNTVGDPTLYAVSAGNYFMFGGNRNPIGIYPGEAVLTPEEAWNIDTKVDDGRATAGKLIAGNWNVHCSNAGAYMLDAGKSVRCFFVFINQM